MSDSKLINRLRLVSIAVDRKTGRITRCFQQEQLETLEKLSGERMHRSGWYRTYDADGLPDKTGHNVSRLIRVQSFAPLNTYEDRDIKDLFSRYLRSHGHEHLVP